MERKDEEFIKRLLDTFKVEAQEHLTGICSGLIELEKAPPERQAEIVEAAYRESHSLKGAARSVNLTDVVSVCQSIETVFSSLKRKKIPISPEILDLLHQAADKAGRLISGEEVSAAERSEIRELILRVDSAVSGERGVKEDREAENSVERETEKVKTETREEEREPIREEPSSRRFPPTQPPAISETIRISTAKLDAILLQAEEMLSVKLASAQRAAELKEIKKTFALWKKERARDRNADRGMRVAEQSSCEMRFADGGITSEPRTRNFELDPFIGSLEARLTALVKAAEYDFRSVAAMVDNLLDDTKKALMLPISSLLEIFPKFVRNLSRDAGKKVELTIEGGEIEIDRRVLEEMKDPLVHLVRNCVDHGIELPEDRKLKEKPEVGSIKIFVTSKDNKIAIEVSDDGAGLDTLKVKNAAVKSGVISQDDADRLDDRAVSTLVFRSGVTTSPIITDISGRGLGLAIVREKAEKLNGTVAIDTRPDIGTAFRLEIPITISTFRGVLVREGEHIFVIPSMNVERVTRVNKEAILTVENRETLSLNGKVISVTRLGDALEIKTGNTSKRDERGGQAGTTEPASLVQIVVLSSAEIQMAFLVDEILSEQEVLAKSLGRQLSRVRNVAGATVLGNGKVVPIINVQDLMKSSARTAAASAAGVTAAAEAGEKRVSVLVVEDSITARTLLKNILESAGYDVKTAVDGVDAFSTLKTRNFDLVVSDVDMPRMNGFDLTAKIRADKKLSELPVVLVTALESREDRERGIEAGAHAYIVKSSFDRSNLLEVLRRLI